LIAPDGTEVLVRGIFVPACDLRERAKRTESPSRRTDKTSIDCRLRLVPRRRNV